MNDLTTTELTEDVKIGTLFEALLRRRVMAISIVFACMALAYAAAKIQHKTYEGIAQMALNVRAPAYASNNVDYVAPEITVDTQVGLMESPAMDARVYDWITNHSGLSQKELDDLLKADNGEKDSDGNDATKDLVYKVENPKDTNLLTVHAFARTPHEAAALADAVCNAFIEWDKELSKADLQKTAASLSVKANASLQILRRAQAAEQQFRNSHDLVDVDQQHRGMLDQMATVQQVADGLAQETASQNAKVAALGKQLSLENTALQTSASVRDDGGVTALQEELDKAEIDLNDANQKYRSAYPGMLRPLQAKVDDLKRRLAAAIKMSVSTYTPSLASQSALVDEYNQARVEAAYDQAKAAAAADSLAKLRSKVKTAPDIEMEYDRLHQQVDIDNGVYTSIQSALNSTMLLVDKVNGNMQITQYSEEPDITKPAKPVTLLYVALGLVLGLAVATLSVAVAEKSDRRIYTLDRLRLSIPALPIGGLETIKIKRRSLPLAQDTLRTVPTRAYSLAAANLEAIWRRQGRGEDEGRRRAIMVTSAIAGEGKTTTAVYLAKLFASSGRSVLLVDCDLNNPSLSAVFPGSRSLGLTDLLEGRAKLSDVVEPTGTEHLSVIHGTGDASGMSMAFASAKRTSDLIRQCMDYAEIVIIDTPPCTVAADATYIGAHVDTIVQVVSLDVVNQEALSQTGAVLRLTNPETYVTFINRLAKGRGYYSSSPYPTAISPALPGDPVRVGSRLPDGINRRLPLPDETY